VFIPSDDRFSASLPTPAGAPAADLVAPDAFPTVRRLAGPSNFAAGLSGERAQGLGAERPSAEHVIVDYRVEVGHVTLSVRGASPAEAIRIARSRLCLELPRLWDVIRSMDDSRFRVVIVEKRT
jgi:hypothetical protein